MKLLTPVLLLTTRVSSLLPAALISGLLVTASCTTVKHDNTLARLEQATIPVTDETVDDSLDKAMESYNQYIQQAPASKNTAEAMRRLANLEVEKNYDIPGLGGPSTPGARAAITHYTRLLSRFPLYDRNDLVLYQLSRAYKETGERQKAAAALQKIADRYPDFEHIDEVYFRLGEYYFREKEYERANQAYAAVLASGKTGAYYQVALNKQGWSYFRQDNYPQALTYFISLLEYKLDKDAISAESGDDKDNKPLSDLYRAISLCFSYLGGANAITSYLENNEKKTYAADLYKQLAEYYLSKKRYTDAANTLQAYIDIHPYSEIAPKYNIRIIESYQQAGFIDLVMSARKQFAKRYDPRADYWKKFKPDEHPLLTDFQINNIHLLASHYHASYKNLHDETDKTKSYTEAIHWYREYIYLYPLDSRTPTMSKQLAELFLEESDYRSSALAFERTAYNYPSSRITAESGYAAIFAYRENLKSKSASERSAALEEISKSSLRFVDNFPQHAEAGVVLSAAASDLLALKNYSLASNAARRVVNDYKNIDKKQLRSAWLVLADASFELSRYEKAEKAYSQALAMTDKNDKNRSELVENLAASIYKQGEQAKSRGQLNTAANHFLRISSVAASSSLRTSSQYDAAVTYVAAKNWPQAARVFEDFRKENPTHKLAEVTSRNLAVIYRNNKDYLKAAAEYESIEKNNKNKSIRRDALQQAAQLYRLANKQQDMLRVYKRYVQLFPSPAEQAIKTYQQIADTYKNNNDTKNYHYYLQKIVSADENAGKERNYQTKKIAARALLVLADIKLDSFEKVTLTKPFKRNLELKKKHMNEAIKLFTRLLSYQISETTSASTYHIAEIYLHFSQALSRSERPGSLTALELEQYELALEEQVYLFEEKSIDVHKKNTELLDAGIYDPWLVKSLSRLSELLPALYAKPEQNSDYLKNLFAQDDR